MEGKVDGADAGSGQEKIGACLEIKIDTFYSLIALLNVVHVVLNLQRRCYCL